MKWLFCPLIEIVSYFFLLLTIRIWGGRLLSETCEFCAFIRGHNVNKISFQKFLIFHWFLDTSLSQFTFWINGVWLWFQISFHRFRTTWVYWSLMFGFRRTNGKQYWGTRLFRDTGAWTNIRLIHISFWCTHETKTYVYRARNFEMKFWESILTVNCKRLSHVNCSWHPGWS